MIEASEDTPTGSLPGPHESTPMPMSTPVPPKSSKLPILLEIQIHGRTQYFSLNSDEYSSYSYEQEVLLQEGIKYKVMAVEQEETRVKERNVEVTVVRLVNVGDKYQRMWWWGRWLRYLVG